MIWTKCASSFGGVPVADGSLPPRDWLPGFTGAPTLAAIIRDVAERHNLEPGDLKKRSRKRWFAWARQEYMWLAYQEGRWTYAQIGMPVGGLDHTTVIHGIRAHADRHGVRRP